MGLFSKDIKTLDDMLLHGLQDIYYAEQQITKALPKMIGQATSRDLAQGLKNHLEETYKQIERLDQVFKKLGQKPSGTDCPAIDGLIKESDETAGENRRQVGARRRDRGECAGGRTLRDGSLRHADRLGRRTRP